ncbi:MAG: hypothetical protein KatS3mg115_1930 [Candidatus Poribacteria bacterium]|nr:MAG: hypothetical protein KatS3mg115_1930 [Candidatus Poribacteria bacterium]
MTKRKSRAKEIVESACKTQTGRKRKDKTSPSLENAERGLIRIGELAAETGTTLRTLHYYEELGLICPKERTSGGFRLYDPSVVRDVRLIQHLRELGLELSQIQMIMEARRTEEGQPAACLRDVLTAQLRRVQSLIHQYTCLRDELSAILDILNECTERGCEHTPGGARCPHCEVIVERPFLPRTFQIATATEKA